MTNEITAPIKIKVNHEYERISSLYPLTTEEFTSLVNSIRDSGQWEAMTVNEKGEILDGHHRFRACKVLNIEPIQPKIQIFPNPLLEKLFVIDVNLLRRQLNPYQRVVLYLQEKKPLLQQLAKLNQFLAGKMYGKGMDKDSSAQYFPQLSSIGRINEKIAKESASGFSARKVDKIEIIMKKGSEVDKNDFLTLKKPVEKVYNKIIREEARKQFLANASTIKINPFDKFYKIYPGDFREIGFDSNYVKPNSVDMILVDSLYYSTTLYLHKNLSELAYYLLRPGGSYLVYLVPQHKEPMLYDLVRQGSNLHFWDRFIVKMQGPYKPNFPTHVSHQTKTLAWFCKGDKPINPLIESKRNLFDLIDSESPDKILSPYTQSQVEAKMLIKSLTFRNDLVLDPMMGVGTTGLTAVKLERRFIGFELSQSTFELAQANFKQNLQEQIRSQDDRH
jgi:hypothetical protein